MTPQNLSLTKSSISKLVAKNGMYNGDEDKFIQLGLDFLIFQNGTLSKSKASTYQSQLYFYGIGYTVIV